MNRSNMIAFILTLVLISSVTMAQESSVLIQTAKVTERSIVEKLQVYGQVQADPDAVQSVSLLHDALVSRVSVRPGQRVKVGDTLLEITTSPGAYMEYLKARAAVDYAQNELMRQKRLLTEHLTTSAQLEAAKNVLDDAQSSLKALQEQGQNKIMEKVDSPASGVITGVNAKQGDRLNAGATLMEIAVGNRLVAVLGVEPEDIHLLEPGTPATIRSVFVPDYHAESQLREIHAIINPSTNLVNVLVPIPPDQTDRLVLGSSLSADIILHAHTGLTVPRSAVLRDDRGAYVFRVVNERGRRVAVTTGLKSDEWIEITSGLNKNDVIVSVGNYELSDGMPIREAQ